MSRRMALISSRVMKPRRGFGARLSGIARWRRAGEQFDSAIPKESVDALVCTQHTRNPAGESTRWIGDLDEFVPALCPRQNRAKGGLRAFCHAFKETLHLRPCIAASSRGLGTPAADFARRPRPAAPARCFRERAEGLETTDTDATGGQLGLRPLPIDHEACRRASLVVVQAHGINGHVSLRGQRRPPRATFLPSHLPTPRWLSTRQGGAKRELRHRDCLPRAETPRQT